MRGKTKERAAARAARIREGERLAGLGLEVHEDDREPAPCAAPRGPQPGQRHVDDDARASQLRCAAVVALSKVGFRLEADLIANFREREHLARAARHIDHHQRTGRGSPEKHGTLAAVMELARHLGAESYVLARVRADRAAWERRERT